MSRFLSDAESPPVSVVINTLNRGDLLGDAIRGVMQLDYPAVELIAVNGPSTDNSEQVLSQWRGRIKHLRCDVPNLSVSRNVGIEAADGKIVAFLDDDAVPHPLWLRHLAKHYADPSTGGVGGFTVDNTGVRWQVRKTVCDRFGNAYLPDDLFDERRLNFPGAPFYPSLLGTNSSFRTEALRQIGGFDHTFAYLLDETDVCLRLVDAGWNVFYEPAAMIFHQFAESHVRSVSRKPKTLYPSVVSKSYFISRHGQKEGFGTVAKELAAYEDELRRANAWLADHGDISVRHRTKLDEDLTLGMAVGTRRSHEALISGKTVGDLMIDAPRGPFLPLPARERLRVALVSQGYPPENDAGIARWTSLLAKGLRDLDIDVHVITRAAQAAYRRYRDGIWVHGVGREEQGARQISARYALPEGGVADWMSGVMREIAFLKTFGLDLVSFPIWDLEALPVLDDDSLASVLSLHTTYSLARPFKPEWNERIIYGRAFVDRMIAAEGSALRRAPAILANSDAVIREIEEAYGVGIGDRATIVPHGTPDLLADAGLNPSDKADLRACSGVVKVLFAGRFEPRKGYDLALRLTATLADDRRFSFAFAGAAMNDEAARRVLADCGVDPRRLGNATFHGEVDRATLDRLYVDSDVVIMPSRFESFGLVAIEGMSAGAPVLALARGGLAEVVSDGHSGVLFAREDDFLEGARKALLRFADRPAELRQLSQSAYDRYLELYSVEAMARDVAQFYRRTISQRSASA
ncbi:glycosyltransferase [Novosphingobium sp. ERW19]|uniref:glycosyltransferase n=1 Tax=Novosphingobium sp. ERW19 TaxID=2726186 RepID=UPI0014571A28|nr:glycosyltransferase [Novosphingobium sp. ERW19]NLR41455.1 glycosyltransferase [Novosphingobium sp. ERW19]